MSPHNRNDDGGSRHERWHLAAPARGSSALFHNDADFPEGYGVEEMIQASTALSTGSSRKMKFFAIS
jgi:hypothetical protein